VDVALTDVDLDGDLDIATVATDVQTADVLLGDGAGHFATLVSSPLPALSEAFVIGDTDADGLPDIASVHTTLTPEVAGCFDVLRGNGLGVFLAAGSWPADYWARGLVIADLDDDGFAELVSSTWNPAGSAMLLVNDGAGGFLPPQFHSACALADDVAVADMDADGRPDVLGVGNDFETGDLFLLPNLGPEEPRISLGFGKPGQPGIPVLVGDGTLQAGATLSLTLNGALAVHHVVLIVGAAPLFAPLKGGMLVPMPHLVLGGLVTDATGGLALHATWPAGLPAGRQVWFQEWVADPSSSGGYAASNGVTAVIP